MKLVRLPSLLTALCLAACGQAVDPMTEEERLRAEAERSAGLEAAEREILNAGLPLPAEADVETTPLQNEAGGANGATPEAAASNAF
jgi:hypothetical protein